MRRSRQNTCRLKLVMLFDRRKETCCVGSHNLDAEEASQEVADLRRDGLPAFAADQRSRHTLSDPDECQSCRADVQHSIKPLPRFERRKRTT